ncbi:MAG: hypothetical protein HC831_16435 [Chloroflexia bacterium]|nr:hypothetical protein [Chloroflexia bacterium]
MRKKIILLNVIVLLFAIIINAQNKVRFDYDEAGNRIFRTIVLDEPHMALKNDSSENNESSNNEDLAEMEKKFESISLTKGSVKLYPNPTAGSSYGAIGQYFLILPVLNLSYIV